MPASTEFVSEISAPTILGPLQDPVTWYGINYTGTQMTQWDFQNKGKSGWTGKSSFVLEVSLRYLRPSVIYSVARDRILQRAYFHIFRFSGKGDVHVYRVCMCFVSISCQTSSSIRHDA